MVIAPKKTGLGSIRINKSTMSNLAISLSIVLASGTAVFGLLHYDLSLMWLACLSFFLLVRNKNLAVNPRNLIIGIGVLSYALVSSMMNGREGFDGNSALGLTVKLFSLIVLMSNITFEQFSRNYIDILTGIGVVSLICYCITAIAPSIRLPFEFTAAGEIDFYGTFYYTREWGIANLRNSGIWGEPGVYQIFLNVALIFMFSHKNLTMDKGFVFRFLILAACVLTTFSTSGYVCFAMILIYGCIVSVRRKKMGQTIAVAALVLLAFIAFFILESQRGIIAGKLFQKQGSYYTRLEDSITGLKLSSIHPALGFGALSDTESIWRQSGIVSRSNGLINAALSWGWLFVVFYVSALYRHIRRFIWPSAAAALVWLFLIYALNTEPILVWPFCLLFVFDWKKEQGTEIDLSGRDFYKKYRLPESGLNPPRQETAGTYLFTKYK